jgi:hypothetical protein
MNFSFDYSLRFNDYNTGFSEAAALPGSSKNNVRGFVTQMVLTGARSDTV